MTGEGEGWWKNIVPKPLYAHCLYGGSSNSYMSTMVFWIPAMWGMAAGMLILLPLFIVAVVFWLWMLVDALQRKHFDDKLVWILVMLFLSIIGSILYYFLVYRQPKRHLFGRK